MAEQLYQESGYDQLVEAMGAVMMSSAAGLDDVIYFDYNATAPLRNEAFEAMLPHLRTVGNAGSPHALGSHASTSVEHARRQVGDLIGCSPGEIIFTSGATEANNLALHTVSLCEGSVITTEVEHPAVLEAARALAVERSQRLSLLKVTADGSLDVDQLRELMLTEQVALVSVMAANNETGVISCLAEVVEICRPADVLVHTDATQLVGRVPVDLASLDVDLLSLSAHKFGGPQGVGALFVRRGRHVPRQPILRGGGQERGWRGGTLNVAGIVGAGAAAEAARTSLESEAVRVTALRDRLEASLLDALPDAEINGCPHNRLPGVSNIYFPGTPADAVLAALRAVAASDGSACASGAPTPSHVLTAMGLSRDAAECCLRFSLGYASTLDEVSNAVPEIVDAVGKVRKTLGGSEKSGGADRSSSDAHHPPSRPSDHRRVTTA